MATRNEIIAQIDGVQAALVAARTALEDATFAAESALEAAREALVELGDGDAEEDRGMDPEVAAIAAHCARYPGVVGSLGGAVGVGLGSLSADEAAVDWAVGYSQEKEQERRRLVEESIRRLRHRGRVIPVPECPCTTCAMLRAAPTPGGGGK